MQQAKTTNWTAVLITLIVATAVTACLIFGINAEAAKVIGYVIPLAILAFVMVHCI